MAGADNQPQEDGLCRHGLAESLWLQQKYSSSVVFATESAPAAWADADGEEGIGRRGHWASPSFVRGSGAALVADFRSGDWWFNRPLGWGGGHTSPTAGSPKRLLSLGFPQDV